MCAHVHTPTHTHTLSLSHTHTHTQRISLKSQKGKIKMFYIFKDNLFIYKQNYNGLILIYYSIFEHTSTIQVR